MFDVSTPLIFYIKMKATIYIFGNFANGYSQYPDNYTRDLFLSISNNRKSATELLYHRDGALTYYVYIREISNSAKTFIGLCLVFNGIYITDFTYLFDIFEDAITNIVVKGEILEFANDGSLSSQIEQLYSKTKEFQRISDFLNSKLSSLGQYAIKLPPVNYSISNTEWKTYTFDEILDIQNVLKDYSNIRVFKGENYDTNALSGYSYKLKTQNTEIQKLNHEISKQKDAIAKLHRQKKQITWVITLLILVIVGGILFYLYAQDKIHIIQNKTQEITNLKEETQKNEDYILVLQHQNDEMKKKLNDIHNELVNTIPMFTYFDSWSSTNYKQPNSTSQVIFSFYAFEDEELSIPYYVSSEKSYDYLSIILKKSDGSEQLLLKKSGVESDTYTHVFTENDTYQLIVSYSKDGSNDYNYDKAGVSQFSIYHPVIYWLQQISECE